MIDTWAASYVEQFGGACPICHAPVHPAVDVCPRCRGQWRLGLKVTEAYLVAWGLTVAALALQAGLGLFLLFLILLRPLPLHQWMLVGIGLLGVPAAAAMAVLLALRKRFCGLERGVQWLAALGAMLVLIVSSVAFMAFLPH